ncbi:hypothetical protein P4H66_26470 [Paenibacillus dokdonensis]|uniref:Uncharacterized protein n=1 Tax=Paenibacillus dokdonensis TaxID=2567944 RepID=A0ABU6GUD7_9BACL|nr:hypothetical protein [Paenibacillus dokdonensis]MEC0243364.1 hypothetical protein [Paenibacillus dokdonensis]
MNNRPSRFELYFSLLFILALIVTAAAFLSGVQVGANRMEEKYNYLKLSSASPDFTDSYQQQDVVTFYHTVFLPYREFKSEWLAQTETAGIFEKEKSGIFKSLSKLADKKYNEVLQISVYDSSPLLQQSQNNTLKSLRLFSKAAQHAAVTVSNSKTILDSLEEDAYYQNAVKYGLLAQKQYYSSMLKWGTKVSPSIPNQYIMPSTLKLNEWESYPLMVKNEAVASIMLNSAYFSPADPQDITAFIDSWIAAGKTKTYKLSSLQETINFLRKKNAVHQQDFIKLKAQYGGNELLPQLPFFFES